MLLGEVLAFLHRYNRVVLTTAGVLVIVELAQVFVRVF